MINKYVVFTQEAYRRNKLVVKNLSHLINLDKISNMHSQTINWSWDYYMDDRHNIDNRVDFFNFGELYGDLSIEKLQSGNCSSSAQNKTVARFFKKEGIIKRYNSRIASIKNRCKIELKESKNLAGIMLNRLKSKSEFSCSILILMAGIIKL